ncbi:hypothetical protein CSQ90_06155 [Janthinobacterium sp. BJB303]|nr:hypothetical protein CSQ90_06155 [Janthinobacterium sp. BJB303]
MSAFVRSSSVSACRLVFAQGRAPVEIRVRLDWECVGGNRTTTCGKVGVTVAYTDPDAAQPSQARASHDYSDSFDHTQSQGMVLRIIDFQLPPALTQCGIGTMIWSRIHRALDAAGLLPMRLTGGLSSKDATVRQVDAAGRQVRQMAHGAFYPASVPNIARRNAFWQRMLDTADRRFDCDAAGFAGRFIDPAAHRSYHRPFDVLEIDAGVPGGLP